jgi:hypothetical protein
MCRPFGTRLTGLIVPGTTVPGYSLFRPAGLELLRSVNEAAKGGY